MKKFFTKITLILLAIATLSIAMWLASSYISRVWEYPILSALTLLSAFLFGEALPDEKRLPAAEIQKAPEVSNKLNLLD